MADNLARLRALLERMSPAELRLVLRFAEFLAKEQTSKRG
ncbi:hypothetical protein ES703_84017 [subsurface metagenome]